MEEAGRREREYSKGRREMWRTEGGVREKDARTKPAVVRDERRALIAKGSSRTVGRDAEGRRGGGRQGGLPKTDMDCRLFWTSGCGLAKG